MDAARGDVGGDEDLDLATLHAAQSAFALGLGAVAVQGHGGDAALFELAGETVGAVLGAGEDDRALVLFDDVGGELGALVARDAPEVVVDVTGRLFTHDVVDGGVVGELAYERLDVGTHGGREEHDVAVAWRGADDASHARAGSPCRPCGRLRRRPRS